MSSIDETNDKSVEGNKNEKAATSEAKDSPDNKTETIIDADDLAKIKGEKNNEFNAEHNVAHSQIFIQNYNAQYTTSTSSTNTAVTNPDKSYDLRNPKDCSEFVEKYMDGEHLFVAIILCTFEAVSLGDLTNLQAKLMEFLPLTKMTDSQKTEPQDFQYNPYLSMNSIMSVIGGKQFITKDGQQYAGLGEDSIQALGNIWTQFPALRCSIVSWLIQLNKTYEYRTAFDIYQTATAFARVISLDIIDAKKRIFSDLYQNSNNISLLGVLVYKLYEYAKIRNTVNDIVKQWISSNSDWLWKPACLVYVYITDSGNEFEFEAALHRILVKKLLNFDTNDSDFISMLLSQSKHFRSLISNVFHTCYSKTTNRGQKTVLTHTYNELILYSYYKVNSTSIELPLVSCDTKEQQHNLSPIIAQVMTIYPLRRQLYNILKAYMKELSGYNFSPTTINHISAYFYNMTLLSPEYQEDVMYFLKNCQNKISEQVYDRLFHIKKH